MNVLVNMNLASDWCAVLATHGHHAVHWSEVGDAAKDRQVMQWAADNEHIVMTHDLDFSAILAATQARGPSVIQVRTEDTFPGHLERAVVAVLQDYEEVLRAGAIIVVEEWRLRVRVLPIVR